MPQPPREQKPCGKVTNIAVQESLGGHAESPGKSSAVGPSLQGFEPGVSRLLHLEEGTLLLGGLVELLTTCDKVAIACLMCLSAVVLASAVQRGQANRAKWGGDPSSQVRQGTELNMLWEICLSRCQWVIPHDYLVSLNGACFDFKTSTMELNPSDPRLG